MEAYTDRLDVATILGTLRVDTAAGQAIGEAELDALVESLQVGDPVGSLEELHAYRNAGRGRECHARVGVPTNHVPAP